MYEKNPKLDKQVSEFLVNLKIPVQSQKFVPLGEESFAWRIKTDETVLFVKYCNSEKVVPELPRINSLLRSISHLDFVVAPVLLDGKSEISFLDGYLYAYPFIEGKVLTQGNHELEDGLVRKLTAVMGQIHNIEVDSYEIPVEDFRYNFESQLEAILGDIDKGFSVPEVTKEDLLKIQSMIKHFNEQSDRFRMQSPRMVLTHGDITGMNILITDNGDIKLLDWDGAKLAPKERDINFLNDNPSFDFGYYKSLTNSDVFNPQLREYYGYVWSLDSILENIRKLQVYKVEYGSKEYLLEDVKEYLGYYE